jgi:asparagine synthase (glutamine-hydrolysing)
VKDQRVANFLVIVDPEPERRARFIQRILPLLPPVEGLKVSNCTSGSFHAVWAASPVAPISAVASPDDACVLWGDAFDGTNRRVDAATAQKVWCASGANLTPQPWDGFHAAVAYMRQSGQVVVGADLLGFFPIYYHSTGDTLLLGSSPELFRHHDAFRPVLDPAGLAGILLTAGSFENATLWQGVRRLPPGHLLRWSPHAAPREVRQYQQPVSDQYFDRPLQQQVELLHGALTEALQQQTRSVEPCTLLLSGGRDSRLLAGVLHRQRVPLRALTFGRASDHEVRCATAVAHTLNFEHTVAELPAAAYPEYAVLHATWEHSVGNFGGVYTWGTHRFLVGQPKTVVLGHALEHAVAGPLNWATGADGTPSADALLANLERHAIPAARLQRLLRPEAGSALVADLVSRMRALYQSYQGTDSQRALRFLIEHWRRFHAGSAAWRFSFGAWPILPVLNQQLLAVSGALPWATLGQRLAQDTLLSTRFPELARLPLDRNAANAAPIAPGLGWQLRERLLHKVPGLARVRAVMRLGRTERRYYVRIYDINGPGWLGVRRAAEPFRARLQQLCDPAELDRLIPPAPTRMVLDDPIVDSFGPKLLLGLMHWAGRQPAASVEPLLGVAEATRAH